MRRDFEMPDRACAQRGHEHFHLWAKLIGVKLNGVVLMDVHEFCVSEGWVRRFVRDERGRLVTRGVRVGLFVKRHPVFQQEHGVVELYWR